MKEATKNTTAPKMATFEEINRQIKTEREKAQKREAARAYDAIMDEYREVLRAYHKGEASEAEKIEGKQRELKAIEALKCEQESNADHIARAEILTENAKQAFFAQYIGKICAIWNKYAGKPHGEKTADKIREELRAVCGQNVYIGNEYNRAKISIYTARGVYIDNFEIGSTNADAQRATDENNKILPISADGLRVWYCSEYVYNINAHIKALKKAHSEAKKAVEKAREAFSRYNDLTRGNMHRANLHEARAPHTIVKY